MSVAESTAELGTRLRKALDTAVESTMNALGERHGLAPLVWRLNDEDLVDGSVTVDGSAAWGLYDPVQCASIVKAWAEVLDLAGQPTECGTVEYAGALPGVQVTVWAVVDRELFEEQ